jgi:ribA/ribD-fused uncharacterized protein
MIPNFECSSSSGRTTLTPSGNGKPSGIDATPKRKVKKPVVKVLKAADEQPARSERGKRPASAGSTTTPAFKPEVPRQVKETTQPGKDDSSTSSEETDASSSTITRPERGRAGTPARSAAPGSMSSPRSDTVGQAILAIERGNLKDFKKLVPVHVPVDSISSQGRSLLAIATFHKQPQIVGYIRQQLTGRAIKAIESCDPVALKNLVPAQVEPDAVSTRGRSLLAIARYQQQQLAEIINYLESRIDEDDQPSSVQSANSPAAVAGARGGKVQVIEFYDKQADYYEFTNFYQGKPIEIDGVSWKTAEHYFQAQKFVGKAFGLQEVVREKASARGAFKFARANNAHKRADWEEAKVGIAQKVLEAKFRQDKHLRSLLCGTGNAQLVEASPNDDYWGYGPDGAGQNMLGELLMELRTELQEEI